MGFSDTKKHIIHISSSITKDKTFVPKVEIKHEILDIRPLTKNDIAEIKLARKCQEEENGNGATEEYLKKYGDIIEQLFDKNAIIGAGAFNNNKLVSLAFFNLINFGNKRKIPYLCAVWTNPEYRGKKLARKVNEKLLEGVTERIDEMQGSLLLTVEGGEAAHRLYAKEGYTNKNGEMSFLGDICVPQLSEETQVIEKEEKYVKNMKFTNNNIEQLQINYSEEQFFSHPSNISGKMYRITSLDVLDKNLTSSQLQYYLQYFLSKHRFCKFNTQELIQNNTKLLDIFELSQQNSDMITNAFENFSFPGMDGNQIYIKRSDSVMENTIQNVVEFQNAEKSNSALRVY